MLAPVPTITINVTNKTMNTISSVFIKSTNQHRPFHNARSPLRSSDARSRLVLATVIGKCLSRSSTTTRIATQGRSEKDGEGQSTG